MPLPQSNGLCWLSHTNFHKAHNKGVGGQHDRKIFQLVTITSIAGRRASKFAVDFIFHMLETLTRNP